MYYIDHNFILIILILRHTLKCYVNQHLLIWMFGCKSNRKGLICNLQFQRSLENSSVSILVRTLRFLLV